VDQPDPRDDATRAESLGRTIKLYRTAWDMSRKELAEKAGLSYSYVSEIENGGKHPSTKALHLIARALDTSPARLMDASEDLPELTGTLLARESGAPYLESRRQSGARARQRRWLDAPSPISQVVKDAPWDDLHDVLGELERLLAELEPDDRERVLDLARRLRAA